MSNATVAEFRAIFDGPAPTAARDISIVIATANLTAGQFDVGLYRPPEADQIKHMPAPPEDKMVRRRSTKGASR